MSRPRSGWTRSSPLSSAASGRTLRAKAPAKQSAWLSATAGRSFVSSRAWIACPYSWATITVRAPCARNVRRPNPAASMRIRSVAGQYSAFPARSSAVSSKSPHAGGSRLRTTATMPPSNGLKRWFEIVRNALRQNVSTRSSAASARIPVRESSIPAPSPTTRLTRTTIAVETCRCTMNHEPRSTARVVSTPSSRRSRAIPRLRWVFTVPGRTPIAAAMSASSQPTR